MTFASIARSYTNTADIQSAALSFYENDRQEIHEQTLPRDIRKHWEVSGHCDQLLFPQDRPEITFECPGSNYNYQRLIKSDIPDQELVRLLREAHYSVLARLNQSKLQVRNFILPVQLIKMKFIDPFSRQRIIENLCSYLSLQKGLCNVVLEQAEIKFVDLCRILVALANTKVKKIYLWGVLNRCDKPFEGPLQSEIVLDDLPRIPFTYNPGGRKYLRDLEKENKKTKYISFDSKESVKSKSDLSKMEGSYSLENSAEELSEIGSQETIQKQENSKEMLIQIDYYEDVAKKHLPDALSLISIDTVRKNLLKDLSNVSENIESLQGPNVVCQIDVGIQCKMSQASEEITKVPKACRRDTCESIKSLTDIVLQKAKTDLCKHYLKYYENSYINIKTLREIYLIALSNLQNLTELSVNYCLLADGTGDALLSIGSLSKGKLQHLQLLCELEDLPSPTSEVYNKKALQAIPDLIWHSVKQDCPELKVHIICVGMSAYEITKRFVTKSIPLYSFHMENGFCPTIMHPHLTIFCTLKCLYLNYKDTLEHVNINLWHSTGRIDRSLEILIENTSLCSFIYFGPLQYKETIKNLCNAALASPRMQRFKLMVQGDPCFPYIARRVAEDYYREFQPRFLEKSINFVLGSHNN